MALLTKEEFTLYENIINLSQKNTRLVMLDYLKKKYDYVVEDEAFIYAVGTIPVALVAHMDTVFEESPKDRIVTSGGKTYMRPERKVTLYYDQWREMIACPDGAGFDDRAGIYAIFKIIESGLKPSIILTTDEEIGGVGALKFVNKVKEPLSDLRYIIQLDRRGTQDCVFYDLESPEFQSYIEGFGFKTNWGSFSDISTICPAWKIAGVNLSIGYENEHTTRETLNIQAWLDTIEKVKVMLQESDIPFWEYKGYLPIYGNYPYGDEFRYAYGYGYGYSYGDYYDDDYYVRCAHCKNEFDIFETMPHMNKDGKTEYYCLECEEHMKKCEKCGEYYYQKNSFWKYCKPCAKEMRKLGKRNPKG